MDYFSDCENSPGQERGRGDDSYEIQVDQVELAARLRQCLADALQRLSCGATRIRHPGVPIGLQPGGLGHFHLAVELFIQLSGWTEFQFPQGGLRLEAGEVLVVPPRLLHSERVGPESDGRGFENLVVYAEAGAFRCHLAQEVAAGVPGFLYVDMGRHAQASLIQEWLGGAVLTADEKLLATPVSPVRVLNSEASRAWADIQSRALVTAALAGVLRALDDPQDGASPEPMPVSRVRVMVQNQLGDSSLTVRRLATLTGYTADYLSNLFSVTTGEHLSAYINRLRVERAAHLLRESALAGKEVAWACGFSSPSYFIRAFRAQFGQTPKAWRQANR